MSLVGGRCDLTENHPRQVKLPLTYNNRLIAVDTTDSATLQISVTARTFPRRWLGDVHRTDVPQCGKLDRTRVSDDNYIGRLPPTT